MKRIFPGIIALVIPFVLFAQVAKEAQDLNQIQQKVSKLGNETVRLKQQLNSVQKSLVKMNEAESRRQMDILKQDSVTRAAQDTVRSYSGRILNMEKEMTGIRYDLKLRCIGMIVFVIVLILLIIFRWWVHSKADRKAKDELYEKMNSQREEREKRIAELRAVLEKSQSELLEKLKNQREEREKRIAELRVSLDQSEKDLSAMKKETGERLIILGDNIAHLDKDLKALLTERTANLESQIKDGLGRIKKENEEGGKEFLKKIENMQALLTSVTSKITELGQKVGELGKKG